MELSINLKNKKDGYELIDGQNSTTISISKEKTWGIDKKLTPLLNYSTVTDFVPRDVIYQEFIKVL